MISKNHFFQKIDELILVILQKLKYFCNRLIIKKSISKLIFHLKLVFTYLYLHKFLFFNFFLFLFYFIFFLKEFRKKIFKTTFSVKNVLFIFLNGTRLVINYRLLKMTLLFMRFTSKITHKYLDHAALESH